MCLYDFTVRSRIPNFFLFRVSKPVKVISSYFGDENDEEHNGNMDNLKYLFVPFANKEITIYDKSHEKKRKRIESESICEEESKVEDEGIMYNQLLMCRESHSWVYKGFESHFQKLFDEENDVLFQNWTILGCYGDEIRSLKFSEQFINEILSFKEIDKLQKDPEILIQKGIKSLFNVPKHQSFKASEEYLERINMGIIKKKKNTIRPNRSFHFEKYRSLTPPKWETQRMILETAYEVATSNANEDDDDNVEEDEDNEPMFQDPY